jgi:hypothetical protein
MLMHSAVTIRPVVWLRAVLFLQRKHLQLICELYVCFIAMHLPLTLQARYDQLREHLLQPAR